MPIFEYQCTACANEFQTLVRPSWPAPECPECHSTELRKKLSAFAAVLGSSAAQQDMPAACHSCGHPDGPGACAFH